MKTESRKWRKYEDFKKPYKRGAVRADKKYW